MISKVWLLLLFYTILSCFESGWKTFSISFVFKSLWHTHSKFTCGVIVTEFHTKNLQQYTVQCKWVGFKMASFQGFATDFNLSTQICTLWQTCSKIRQCNSLAKSALEDACELSLMLQEAGRCELIQYVQYPINY